jgi:hypothetical protein
MGITATRRLRRPSRRRPWRPAHSVSIFVDSRPPRFDQCRTPWFASPFSEPPGTQPRS